ncbi:hypothetical protein L917_01779, partial [Phytophthora nicotianae]
PHHPPSDPDIVAAGTEGGWNIRIWCQAPYSPVSRLGGIRVHAEPTASFTKKGYRSSYCVGGGGVL